MMNKSKKERVALFRFGVIAPLLGVKQDQRGQKESLLSEITSKVWEIPYSGRSSISRSTVLLWLTRYEKSGGRLESLYPGVRSDKGQARSLDGETELALIKLKKELCGASLQVILKVGRERGLLPLDFKVSLPSIYRMFKRYGLDREQSTPVDRRRFEAEMPNDLWQSDCMHGPEVIVEGKLKKVFLFGFIDDHSRLIPHAQFYPRENLQNYLHCLEQALLKRGLCRKLYVDNGPYFRSHHLAHVTASLGIALIHARAYCPEGKGKIERWHRTLRMQFLPTLPGNITLSQLNDRLLNWIDKEYHLATHSSTRQSPLERYQKHLHMIRPAPENLRDSFRIRVIRKVDKDRTVSLLGRVYEAPVNLIGCAITLLYHQDRPEVVEIFWKDQSRGFLSPLNLSVNARIRRSHKVMEILPKEKPQQPPADKDPVKNGKLFGRSKCDHE